MSRRHKRGPADERYVALPVRTLDTLTAAGLEPPLPCASTLYLALWCSPLSTRIPGVLGAGRAALAEALRWSQEDFDAAFAKLEAAGLVFADWGARVVYLPGALSAECSRPASPSTAACWRREIAALGRCALVERIDADLEQLLVGHGRAFVESYRAGKRSEYSRPGLPAGQAAGLTAGLTAGLPAGLGGGLPSPAPSPSPSPVLHREPGGSPPLLEVQDKAPRGKPPKPPLPYQPDAFVQAVAVASKGKLVPSELKGGQSIALIKAIRKGLTLDDGERIGAWLAAGGDSRARNGSTVGVGLLVAAVGEWAAQSAQWDAGGRQAIGWRGRVEGQQDRPELEEFTGHDWERGS